MEILFYIAGVALGLALVVALVGWCGWRWIGRILERLAQEEEMGRMGRMGQMGPMATGR